MARATRAIADISALQLHGRKTRAFPWTLGRRKLDIEEPMEEGPEQDALFCIEGPDEDGCVWICSAKGRDVWCQNLGPAAKVAAVISQWLGAGDFQIDSGAARDG